MSLMPSDDAAGCGAQQAVVAGIMAGDATNQRALDASLGLRHRWRQNQEHCESH
jgi:hypothetical protein